MKRLDYFFSKMGGVYLERNLTTGSYSVRTNMMTYVYGDISAAAEKFKALKSLYGSCRMPIRRWT